MDLSYKPEAVLYRDIGNVVEQRRMDVDKSLAPFHQRTPEADQVRYVGSFGAVLTEP
jgi:aminoglycoside phosphotransferase family enzyme